VIVTSSGGHAKKPCVSRCAEIISREAEVRSSAQLPGPIPTSTLPTCPLRDGSSFAVGTRHFTVVFGGLVGGGFTPVGMALWCRIVDPTGSSGLQEHIDEMKKHHA